MGELGEIGTGKAKEPGLVSVAEAGTWLKTDIVLKLTWESLTSHHTVNEFSSSRVSAVFKDLKLL